MSEQSDAAEAGVPAKSIEALLSGGDPRTLRNVDLVVDLGMASHDRLAELLECVFSDDEIVRMRASDALEKVCRERPHLLEPHVEQLLTDMAEVEQPSVQWHLSQMLREIALNDRQRARAANIVERQVARSGDWIVINHGLETMAALVRRDPQLRPRLMSLLDRHAGSPHKSVASRTRRLLAEFGT